METVTDTFFIRKIYVETHDIYGAALRLMDSLSPFGTPSVSENAFETDGPRKRVRIAGEMKTDFDNHSSLLFIVKISGESGSGLGFLEVHVTSVFQMVFPLPEGLVYGTFVDYYAMHMAKTHKDRSKSLTHAMFDVLYKSAKTIKDEAEEYS